MPLFSNAALTFCLAMSSIGKSLAVAGPMTYTSSPNLFFDNLNPVVDTIVVDDDIAICDVDLFVDIEHTFTDDIVLSLKLTNPQTITMTTLVDDRCGSSDDLIVTFDDSSTNEFTDPQNNLYQFDETECAALDVKPQESLAVYNGKSSKGTWTLDLQDDFIGDDGTLRSWSVIITPCCESETGGACMGDPHFKTWGGDWYDFHGMCDLVFLDHPDFASGKGMSIHIRTKSRFQYSYIESAAVKIGEDVLEVGAYGAYMMNGISQASMPNKLDDSYNVTYEMVSDKEHKFRIELDEGFIIVQAFKDLLSVSFESAIYGVFGGSQGMMGQFGTGKMLGRNGTTIVDPDEFGNEWQVRDTEPTIFQTKRSPQFPEKCSMPSQNSKEIRRLGESLDVAAAEKACAHWGDNKDLCVYDVLAMNDLEVAEMAGAF